MRNLLIITLFFASLSVSGQAGNALPRSGRPQQQEQRNDQQRRNDRPNRNNERPLASDVHKMAPNGLKRIKEIKTAYITKKLDLTPEQSGKFWPLYNQYQDEMFAIQKQIRLNNSPLQTNGKDQVLNELSLDEKKNTIKKHYAIEFLKILPAEKVSLIYKSEKDFQDEVIKQMRERRNEADN